MKEQAPDLVSLSLVRGEVCHERFGLGRRPPQTRLPPLPALYVRQAHESKARAFAGLKHLIRPFVRAIYLFPLLLVAKIVLWVLDHPAGDYITVAFVALLVVFFTLLALLALLYPLVGPASKRKTHPALALDRVAAGRAEAQLGLEGLEPTSPERLESLLQQREELPAVRLRGRVRHLGGAGGAGGGPLLADGWAAGEKVVARLFTGRAFVLQGSEGQPLTAVALESPPLLVGSYAGGAPQLPGLGADEELGMDLGGWLADRSHDAIALREVRDGGRWLRLEEGQEVELVATRGRVLHDVDSAMVAGRRLLAGAGEGEQQAGGPYRQDGTRRGLLLTSTPEDPVLVRVL